MPARLPAGRRRYVAFRGSPDIFGDCPVFLGVLQSGRMAASSTLEVGARAPEFTLAAANREGTVSLAELIARGPVILEFLRGTW
jgi:hypothetical protein